MVLIVLCFGVEFLCCLHLMYVLIFQMSSDVKLSDRLLAHSAYDTFPLYMYKYLILNLVFPTSVFGVGISF